MHNPITNVLKDIEKIYPFKLSSHLSSLLKNQNCEAISKQFYPSMDELLFCEGYTDPIGDDEKSPIKGLVHRYPDRVLILTTRQCFAYCRFCFRKASIGEADSNLTYDSLAAIFQYLRNNHKIWEVILTGGDPLILSNDKLKYIINSIENFNHIKILRIHTRAPIVEPSRINDHFIEILKSVKLPIYFVLHCNHPDELSSLDVKIACRRLITAGIPLLSQSVLLKGINDSVETIAQLTKKLLENRIKPYYLHNCDLAKGNFHFRVDISKGLEIIAGLRYNYSGLCQPTYIIDIPGGYGKVPLGVNYLKDNRKEWIITDSMGNSHRFPKI